MQGHGSLYKTPRDANTIWGGTHGRVRLSNGLLDLVADVHVILLPTFDKCKTSMLSQNHGFQVAGETTITLSVQNNRNLVETVFRRLQPTLRKANP